MGSGNPVRRPDRFGQALVIAFAIAVSVFATNAFWVGELREKSYFFRHPEAELGPIFRAYGPKKNTRGVEEWLIRDFFKDSRGGVFLDVGAGHYQIHSNTYFLERELGWSGVGVDALQEFAADYHAHRPRTTFVAMFASDVTDRSIPLFVPDTPLKEVASSSYEFTKREGTPGKPRQVPTTTLNDVLEQLGVSRVDFMSMDIELSEPAALRGFDMKRYRPRLVCIESHVDVRQQILDYFHEHDYVVVGKYLRVDPMNLYFTPRGRAPTPVSEN
jgi:FkbM family methyltransferase